MKKLFSLFLALLAVVTISAEPKKKFDPEAYRAEQHKFIKCRAQFTNEEATKFFAIYDEMRTKERQLFVTRRKGRYNMPETEEECHQAIINKDNAELQLKKLQQLYHKRMLKVLPAKKVMLALIASEDFDRYKFGEMTREAAKHNKPDNKKDGKCE